MNTLTLDLQAIRLSRGGIPHGYVLPNGVVVIWSNGTVQNKLTTLEQARVMFPTLVLISETM